MKTLKDKIQKFADEIAQQEIDFGLKKRKRSAPAQEVFSKAIEWLAFDALAAQVVLKMAPLLWAKIKIITKRKSPTELA